MKQILLLITITFITFQLSSQSCFENGLLLTNQSEVDNFLENYPECLEIGGDLTIFFSQVENLNGLQNIEEIGGNLIISESNNLSTLAGLENLKRINQNLVISDNNGIQDLNGLDSLQKIGGALLIEHNFSLKSISSIQSLREIGQDIKIEYNSLLDTVVLSSIKDTVTAISIKNNENLKSVYFGDELKAVQGRLSVDRNPNLDQIVGFSGVITIGLDLIIFNNPKLKQFLGFDALQAVEDRFDIHENNELLVIPSFNSLLKAWDIQISIDKLKSIDGFYNLSDTILEISLWSDSLTLINGFNNVKVIKSSFNINATKMLNRISGFENLNRIRSLSFNICPKLSEIDAFDNLEIIDSILYIAGLNSLQDLEFLRELKKVNEIVINDGTTSDIPNGLEDISGISNIDIEYLDYLRIKGCPYLSVCNNPSICEYLEFPESNYQIEDNAMGCNSREEILEACEMVNTDNITNSNIAINLYPNPAKNIITIDCPETIENIKVYEVNGQKVKDLNSPSNQLDVSNLKSGLYLFILKTKDAIYTKKVTITNKR